MKPIIAIIGRPNVGKSQLFNYLIGKRLSIVDDVPGVTRDRIVAETTWNGVTFDLVDTAGIEEIKGDNIKEQMMLQTDAAIEIADIVLFLVDAKIGLTAEDKEIHRKLKKAKKKVVLAVNKCDKFGELPDNFYDFYEIGEPLPISAATYKGLGDMLDRIVEEIDIEQFDIEDERIKVAIIGKPNVGKSSIINRIIGENRSIVSNVAGTTRDAVDVPVDNSYGRYIFIDTAGIRKKKKIDDNIEKYSIIRSELAVERADIAILVIDAEEGIKEQDTKILGIAHNMGKGILVLVNKWDTIEKDNSTYNNYLKEVQSKISYASYAPIMFVSAKTGLRISEIYPMLNRIRENTLKRITTADVNRILEESIAMNQPPSDKGKKLKIYYGTQSGVEPPTFTIFVNDKNLFHFSYQRYILNNFRKAEDFKGVRLKINIKESGESKRWQ